jgi:uncharacterized Zn finger protein
MGWYSRSRSRSRRSSSRFPRYVSVAERQEEAAQKIKELTKKGKNLNPVIITGRAIANTFWGKAWCKHLESYSDYENRLPRGRGYVRSGSILDLAIDKSVIQALVQGSSLYTVTAEIQPCDAARWQKLISLCSDKIDSLIELLQGKFSKSVMEIITDKSSGLFPDSHEIKFDCSCPDYATMCKHVAAVLYGIGARLDTKPEVLFVLRNVDHVELIHPNSISIVSKTKGSTNIKEDDLSALFDIDIEDAPKVTAKEKATPKIKDKAKDKAKSKANVSKKSKTSAKRGRPPKKKIS